MTRKNFLKRIVSGFVSAAIAMTSLPITPIFAETGTNSYSFDGYNVEYSVKNEWSDGQAIEVKITNTGDEPILNWAFKYNAQGEISDLWNASVYDAKETSYIIKNAGWNYEIAPDASVSFGYTLSDYSGTNPEQFELCAKRVDKTDGYDVQYNITNEWDTGLQGEIVITNTSEEPLEAWELSFDSTFAINNLWDGRIISSEENHYVVASEMWSNPINAGESKIIGFTGTKQNADESAISSFNLSVVVIDSDVNSGGNGGNTGNDPNPNPEIDVTTDTDSDKIPDAYEEIFGTDKNKPDTDDDGLTDYEEITLTGTDPLVYDSVTEGISDADADCDEDGLANKEELKLGTSPTDADTDFDGLSDYDEINVYNTDPLNPDTDEDGINDGDEIKLGLDPNSDTTDGVKDTERITHQVISSDSDVFSYMNDEDNPLKISVEIDAAGLAENCMTVDKSKYYHAIENSAVVGVIPEFEYVDGLKVENMTIKFEVDEIARANKIGSYAKECAELEGIKRLNVFEYFDDIGVLLPIETHHDVENNVVYAETGEMGTYCVLDMEIWFKNLGIDPVSSDDSIEVSHIDLTYNSAASLSDENTLDRTDSQIRENVDLALCLDTRTCVSNSEFSEMKQAIKYIVNLCYDNKLNVGDIYVYYQDKNGYHKKNITQSNLSVLDSITRSIDAYYISNNQKVYYYDQTAMLEYTYNNIGSRETVLFFISNKDDIVCSTRLADKVKTTVNANADRVHIVMIGKNMYVGRGYYADDIVKATNGLVRKALDEYTVGDVLQTYLEPTCYKILLAGSFEEVGLKGMLRKASDIDSDDDKLSDWEEINFDVVNLFKSNPSRTYCFNSQFPTIQEYIDYKSNGKTNLLLSFEKYEPYSEDVSKKTSVPPSSSPVLPDTDFDGIDDCSDKWPSINITSGVLDNEFSSSISYKVDFSEFLKNNESFDPELSTLSSVFSAIIYDNNIFTPYEISYKNNDKFLYDYNNETVPIKKLLMYHGFDDIEVVRFEKDRASVYCDQHLTDVAFGRRRVIRNNECVDVLAIIIRGTNDQTKEWSSNFEIGNTLDFNTKYRDEWLNVNNHMGFDITATRVINEFNNYYNNLFNQGKTTRKVSLWITGHSRGGAIANIVGSRLDEKYKTFVYTFASPRTTTSSEKERLDHKSIFNVINTDDIITELPLTSWTFNRYGEDRPISIETALLKNEWKYLTKSEYHSDDDLKRVILDLFYKLSESRDQCYKFTCNCHGDGSDDNINYYSWVADTEIIYGKDYQIIEPAFLTYSHCETTAYFMQYLARLASSRDRIFQTFFTVIAPRYNFTRTQFALYHLGNNTTCGHHSIGYYLISDKV